MKNIKFAPGDLDKAGWMSVEIKAILEVHGISTTTPVAMAAMRLVIRSAEKLRELTLEQVLAGLTEVLETGKDNMNLRQELEFIMADMEAEN